MPGSVVATAIFSAAAAGTWYYAATAFAVNMIASTIVAKAFSQDVSGSPSASISAGIDPGSKATATPAGNNKLPVVYGSGYVGGIVTDMSISSDNQVLFYSIALAEVTNTESGNNPDQVSFGKIYYGGKLCIFDSTGTNVSGLLDESTGITDSSINGYLQIFLYSNGSDVGYNTTTPAYDIIKSTPPSYATGSFITSYDEYGSPVYSDITYQTSYGQSLSYDWDSSKKMTNTAFAVVRLTYNREKNVTGLQQFRFQVINSRYKPGDCISDYLQSTRYGAAIPASQIDSPSLIGLNAYSNESFSFTDSSGNPATQTRFRFDGSLDTSQSIMSNLQLMAACCDCLLKYSEISGTWGVVIQDPSASVVMDINDSNMVSALTISPIDLAGSYNAAEVKFPDGSEKDSFNSATFDLAEIAPSLLYPNEPANKQSITLPLVSNNVRAQYLAIRFLKAAREDLQVQVRIDYSGLQLEAGDVVTMTNANYGWVAKPFRITRVTETFGDDGSVTASLMLSEYNSSVYDDASITQFQTANNSGLSDPSFFGSIPAPVVSSVVSSGYQPEIQVTATTSSAGVTQYVELWYSPVPNPLPEQLFFVGTSDISPNGNPYATNFALPPFQITTIEIGTYYFFSRMRNALLASNYSPPSEVLIWRPIWIADVSGFVNSSSTLTWEPVSSANLAGYKIKFQYGVNYDWNSANPLFNGVVTSTKYDAISLPSGRLTLLIKAIDTSGHESVNATSLVYTPGGLLTSNIVYSYDFKANGWPGTIVGGSVVGGNIVATTTDSFYGADDQSLYGLDSESFYELTTVTSVTYTTSQIYVTGALTGSVGALFPTIVGKNAAIEYRRVSGVSFYGPDGDSLYGQDPDASFYAPDSAWSQMPGALAMANDYYQFRISVGSGSVGGIDALLFQVDAPNIVETLSNQVVNGGAVAYTSDFTVIKSVLVTLQKNSLGVVSVETDKTIPLSPTVTGYNSAHVATSGALADITLQGY